MNQIAKLNDSFRALAGLPQMGGPAVPGAVFVTDCVAALKPEVQMFVLSKVRTFRKFSEDNDPWAERDFGSFDVMGVGKVFWKIDYFASRELEEGSPDPADPSRCFRVLTVMLAEEY